MEDTSTTQSNDPKRPHGPSQRELDPIAGGDGIDDAARHSGVVKPKVKDWDEKDRPAHVDPRASPPFAKG